MSNDIAKKRRIILGGDIIKTRKKAKYVLFFLNKKYGYFLFKNSILRKRFSEKGKIFVEKFILKQAKHLLETIQNHYKNKLFEKFEIVRFGEFKKFFVNSPTIRTINSIDSWLKTKEEFEQER